MNKIYRSLKKNKGQSLVETALVLPIMLLLLTGIIDFGLLFNNYIIVSNASREGVRSAAVGYTDDKIMAVVTGVAAELDEDRLAVSITPDHASGRSTGDAVMVTVQYDYNMITPVIAAIIPQPIRLKSSTTMRCE